MVAGLVLCPIRAGIVRVSNAAFSGFACRTAVQVSIQSTRASGKGAKAGSEGKDMSKGIFWRALQFLMIVLALYSSGCAGNRSIGDFELGPPGDFWCTVDNRSPFPPYCNPDHR